jgi:hypothetical protein
MRNPTAHTTRQYSNANQHADWAAVAIIRHGWNAFLSGISENVYVQKEKGGRA